jgi:hypothetical protein
MFQNEEEEDHLCKTVSHAQEKNTKKNTKIYIYIYI